MKKKITGLPRANCIMNRIVSVNAVVVNTIETQHHNGPISSAYKADLLENTDDHDHDRRSAIQHVI